MRDDLIERLEMATGPDRRLDFAIHNHLFPPDPVRVTDVKLPPGFGDDALSHAMDDRPSYTASIDAALTLVPEGFMAALAGPWVWSTETERAGQPIWEAAVTDEGSSFEESNISDLTDFAISGQGSTPAIALCIAALKARTTNPSPE